VGEYLRRHAYGNTVSGDLWEALDGASEWPVSEIMNTWVYQRGFPQIDVKTVEGGIRLGQRRYLVIPDESDTTIWKVPIQLRGSIAGEPFTKRVLLEEDEMSVDIGPGLDWVVANGGGHGFYRTTYSDDLFAGLLTHIEQLGDVERHSLVSDTLAFVRNGQIDSANFLELVEEFADEREQAIWSVITGGLGVLEHHALEGEARPAFEEFVRSLAGPALDRLGWDPGASDTDLDRKLRGDLIATMGVLGGDRDTIEHCRVVVDDLLAGSSPDPEVATAALTVFARHADDAGYQRLWQSYKGARTPLDQVRFLRAVATVPVDDLAVSTLDKVIQGDIRTQDGYWVLGRLLSAKAGPAVWRSAASRWESLLEVMPGTTKVRIAEGISMLSQPEMAAEVKAFLAEHPVPEASRPIAQNLEKLDANVRLRARETPVVTEYFRRRSGTT
jgi:puromycin-sensitive aminopeptidase